MDLKLISDDGGVLCVEMVGPIVESVMMPDLEPFENLLVEGDLPAESADALKRVQQAGLEPAWRSKLLGDGG